MVARRKQLPTRAHGGGVMVGRQCTRDFTVRLRDIVKVVGFIGGLPTTKLSINDRSRFGTQYINRTSYQITTWPDPYGANNKTYTKKKKNWKLQSEESVTVNNQ